jgi:mannose-1-phosphate guanylyltransferase
LKAILLSAGVGTRLKPITDTIPKCLVRINGIPLMQIWIDLLINGGISKILINTHYLPNQVRDFIEQSKYRNKIELVHEGALLGTAGTLLANTSFFNNEPLLVAHADNLSLFNVLILSIFVLL